MGPGTSTYFLLLHSNASDYQTSATALVGVSALATFAPSPPPIPEPATNALMLTGLLLCGAWSWRRRA